MFQVLIGVVGLKGLHGLCILVTVVLLLIALEYVTVHAFCVAFKGNGPGAWAVLPDVAGACCTPPRFPRRVPLPWVLALRSVAALPLFAIASDKVGLFCAVYPVVSSC